MKPLTIEELKALEVGDWVWVVDLAYNSGKYIQIASIADNVIFCNNSNSIYSMNFYKKHWLAYKNKEQAEGVYDRLQTECDDKERYTIELFNRAKEAERELKEIKTRMVNGKIVELPYKIETLKTGDTVYYIQEYFNDATLKHEREVKRTIIDYITKDHIEVNNGVWLSADNFWLIREAAERRLAELKGEKGNG